MTIQFSGERAYEHLNMLCETIGSRLNVHRSVWSGNREPLDPFSGAGWLFHPHTLTYTRQSWSVLIATEIVIY